MWKGNDGFLLFESLLALFILTVGILFMLQIILFVRQQENQNQLYLELAIFAKEWEYIETKIDEQGLKEKAVKQKIQLIESSEDTFIIEKEGTTLEIMILDVN
ncbi:type IV pilus modification PilV family protein [Vagococcus luciliae]|uniref:Prepilin-type N-terminal cleavage/methylation domain-containing protein n=1 Tax=Vagococcus luciliae TaxID=2920380 RepID=A0ABY5NYG7_9ENTE|nr:hypothetical protein [Vagococcus luciliae]UUV98680.1 hypothetical protein G314FT_08340 [Vagococcus luciliae]